jgi:tRNA threonylcarbamoyladenosine biosynthesis protein TsaB
MACILNIETSASVCSIAVAKDKEIIFSLSDNGGMSHSASLGVFVSEALQYLKKQDLNLDAVALSEGPGSYTGLRIGTSMAKGLCYGLQIPLIAIPTLKLLASIAAKSITTASDALLIPMLDARRMEVYAAVYSSDLTLIQPPQAIIINAKSFLQLRSSQKIYFFGSGSDKCREILNSETSFFLGHIIPNADTMAVLAENKYCKNDFANTAYFEPFYLKEFQATTPRNKIPGL